MIKIFLRHRWMSLSGLIVALVCILLSIYSPKAWAQSGDWLMYQHDLQRHGASSGDGIAPDTANGLELAWSFETKGAPSNRIVTQPIVVNGVVYFGNSDGQFYALDAKKGKPIWPSQSVFLGITANRNVCDPPQLGISSTALYHELPDGQPVIYVGGVDQENANKPLNVFLYALDADTGDVLWRAPVGDAQEGAYTWSSPFIVNNKLYYGVGSHGDNSPGGGCPLSQGKLFVFNPETGVELGQRSFIIDDEGLVGGGVYTTPAVDEKNGVIYLTTGNARARTGPFDFRTQPEINALVALDLDLNTIASWQLPGPSNGTFDLSSGPILFPSGSQDGPRQLVGVGGRNNAFYAFDADDPANISKGPVWIQQIGDRRGKSAREGEGIVSSAAFINGTLYVGGGDRCFSAADRGCNPYIPGSVVALDPASGRIKWRHRTIGRVVGALTGSDKGVLYVPSAMNNVTDNRFEVLDARDGSTLLLNPHEFQARDRLWSGAAAAEDMVFVGSYDGSLYAFRVNPDRITPQAPAPPSGLNARPGNGVVTLSWVQRGDPDATFVIERKVYNQDIRWERIASKWTETSYVDKDVSNGTIYQYRIMAEFSTGVTSRPSQAALAIPSAGVQSPWSSITISTELPSAAESLEDGGIRISAGGGDIFGSADQFQYVFQKVPVKDQEHVEIIARLREVKRATSRFTKAGVDIRAASGSNSTDTGSPHLALFYLIPPGTGLEPNFRTDFYGGTSAPGPHILPDFVKLPVWLKARRRGRQVDAFYSVNGKSWIRIDPVVDFGANKLSEITVGLSVTAHNEADIAQAVFDNITINTKGIPPQSPFNVQVDPKAKTINLSWDPASGADGYHIYRQTNRMGDFELVETVSAPEFVDGDVRPHEVYFYKVSSFNADGEEFNPTEFYARLPEPTDLGEFKDSKDFNLINPPPGFKGDADINEKGVLSVYTRGNDIWGSADSFRFTFQQMCGDGDLIARILHLDRTDEWTKAGIMIRQDDSPGAANFALLWTGNHNFHIQWRAVNSGDTTDFGGDLAGGRLGMFMKIERRGTNFKAYLSEDDGKTWRLVGPPTGVDIPGIGSAALQGIALTSHNNNVGALARFDSIQLAPVEAEDPNGPPLAPGRLNALSGIRQIEISWGAACNAVSYNLYRGEDRDNLTLYRPRKGDPPLTGLTFVDREPDVRLGVTYYYRVVGVNRNGIEGEPSNIDSAQAITLDPFTGQRDIGTGTRGSTEVRPGPTFVVTGSGRDIWDQADGFRFVYKEVTGNVTIKARVVSMTRTDGWAKAGVMIRETLDANSRHFMLLQAYDNGINQQGRPEPGSSSFSEDDLRVSHPPTNTWVRVERNGNTFSSAWSDDGVTWNLISRTRSISMNQTVFVGLAVTAHNEGALNRSTFDNVSITQP